MKATRNPFRIRFFLSVAMLLPWQVSLAQRASIQSIQASEGVILTQLISPLGTTNQQFVDEIEPNNTPDEAQALTGVSPLTLNGNAEVEDDGDIVITFDDNSTDDIEDLFLIVTSTPGLTLALDAFASDCDLYLLNAEADSVLDASLNIGTTVQDPANAEAIDLPALEAGTYIIGVSVFDLDPIGGNATAYTLTITGAIPTAVDAAADVPDAFTLAQNYPNPFNPETQIVYAIAERAPVRLEIFNMQGQKVRTLARGEHSPGTYTVTWDGKLDSGVPAASGVYVYRLQAGAHEHFKTLVLLR